MVTWLISLMIPLLIAALWHGFSLQIATVLAGEEAPGFFRALFVSLLGAFLGGTAGTVWSLTAGLMISIFFSQWLAWGLGFVLVLFVTGAVHRKGLRLSAPAAVGVSGIHAFLTFVVNALLGWLTYSFLVV